MPIQEKMESTFRSALVLVNPSSFPPPFCSDFPLCSLCSLCLCGEKHFEDDSLAYSKLGDQFRRRIAAMFREDLSRNFGFILNDVARLMRTTFDRRVKALGLTRSQWWVLNHLFRNDGVTQSELADILEVKKATLGRLLDRMEQKGWVRREGHAGDRRAKRVFLTDEVEPAIKTMRAAAAEVRREAMSGLSSAGQDQFVDTLLAIKGNLSRQDNGANGNGTKKRKR